MATKSKRSISGTQRHTKTQADKAKARAKKSGKPVLLAYWFEGWRDSQYRVNLYAMPDGRLQEKAIH